MTQRPTSGGDEFSTSTDTGGVTQPLSGVGSSIGTSQQGSTTQAVTDKAKQTASQVGDQARQQASELTDQAKTQVTSQLGTQKERAASTLGSVAQALRQTGQQLREQDQGGMTQYIDRAASQVERWSNHLQNRDVNQIVQEVESYARRQPTLFVGGAFALGVLAARFLKSSSRSQSSYGGSSSSQFSQTGGYDRGYQGSTYGQIYSGGASTGGTSGTYGTGGDYTTYGTTGTGTGGTYGMTGTGTYGTTGTGTTTGTTGLVGSSTSDYDDTLSSERSTTLGSSSSTYGSTSGSSERRGTEEL